MPVWNEERWSAWGCAAWCAAAASAAAPGARCARCAAASDPHPTRSSSSHSHSHSHSSSTRIISKFESHTDTNYRSCIRRAYFTVLWEESARHHWWAAARASRGEQSLQSLDNAIPNRDHTAQCILHRHYALLHREILCAPQVASCWHSLRVRSRSLCRPNSRNTKSSV